jgi:hypothetical protein
LEERQLLTHEQILGGEPCTAAEERSTGTQAVRNGDLQGNNDCRDLPDTRCTSQSSDSYLADSP